MVKGQRVFSQVEKLAEVFGSNSAMETAICNQNLILQKVRGLMAAATIATTG